MGTGMQQQGMMGPSETYPYLGVSMSNGKPGLVLLASTIVHRT